MAVGMQIEHHLICKCFALFIDSAAIWNKNHFKEEATWHLFFIFIMCTPAHTSHELNHWLISSNEQWTICTAYPVVINSFRQLQLKRSYMLPGILKSTACDFKIPNNVQSIGESGTRKPDIRKGETLKTRFSILEFYEHNRFKYLSIINSRLTFSDLQPRWQQKMICIIKIFHFWFSLVTRAILMTAKKKTAIVFVF